MAPIDYFKLCYNKLSYVITIISTLFNKSFNKGFIKRFWNEKGKNLRIEI